MIPARRAPWVGALVGLYVLALSLAVAGLAWAQLDVPAREALRAALGGEAIVTPVLVIVIGAVVMGVVAALIHESYAGGIARLAERVNVTVSTGDGRPLPVRGVPEMRQLAEAINRLADAHANALRNVEARVSVARADSEDERNRLAALIEEWSQAVVVCNAEGRILLYNGRARALFDCLPGEAGGGFVGLGRSLAGVLDGELVSYLRESLATTEAQGEARRIVVMTATPGGRLLRLRAAPLPAVADSLTGEVHAGGMVVVAEDVTRNAELDARRSRAMQGMLEAQRSGLASIRLTAETLCATPDLDAAERAHMLGMMRDSADQLGRRLAELDQQTELWSAGWQLEQMRGTDLLMAACRRIEARADLVCQVEYAESELWLRTDSFSLIQALSFLAVRVHESCGVRELRLRLSREGSLALLDLVWFGTALSTETVLGWELEPMTLAGESSPLSVREVMQRHDAELVYQRDRASTRAFLRCLLPAAEPAQVEAVEAARPSGRPEFFDFDLFNWSTEGRALEDFPLSQLAYTVFDTETTGLDPSGGDEIIQIGAVRILNGRLLRQERYEQLVDPRRPVPPESIAIHGITPDRLRGQPTIQQVLPQFHAFAADTVLVAHNAAFDMRFLQLKEAVCGVRFDQPVLDTLLLSAVLHPNQDSHRLEAIAERFGVGTAGRHTAAGDALLTAQIFLRMIPQLEMRGLHTLGQVRAASKETWHARIRY